MLGDVGEMGRLFYGAKISGFSCYLCRHGHGMGPCGAVFLVPKG